jgi:hypothetical protein
LASEWMQGGTISPTWLPAIGVLNRVLGQLGIQRVAKRGMSLGEAWAAAERVRLAPPDAQRSGGEHAQG